MPSTLPSPVPSRTLLRFLQLQSEGISFFRPSRHPGCQLRKPPSGPFVPCAAGGPCQRLPARHLSTAAHRRDDSLRATSWRGDFLLPRVPRRGKSNLSSTPGADGCTPEAPGRPPWHERFWRKVPKGPGLEPGDLPEEDAGDFSFMFNARRLQTAKAALEPRLRCTEVDENGKVILVDGEFKKTELIAKVRQGSSPSWRRHC